MKDKELRKLIGSRAKQRRQELGLKQPYVAEKMGVTASTIQRYEAGTIDNTKKLVLDGLHLQREAPASRNQKCVIHPGGYSTCSKKSVAQRVGLLPRLC